MREKGGFMNPLLWLFGSRFPTPDDVLILLNFYGFFFAHNSPCGSRAEPDEEVTRREHTHQI